ncbi:MAG TPA: DUF1175 family protein [Pyrinomonadaceae bacterium]|nr:DUF1175 family protein [Pyrinomonadaceae bacterium]
MRAPLKRWLVLASIIFISTASLAWSFTRLRRPEKLEGAPALEQKAAGRRQKADNSSRALSGDQPTSPSCPTCPSGPLIDSDNDGIPDVIELRTFQDRDSFRRWFTAIAEIQFYQLSDQWNVDQRDCAGLARFAIREALRRHDRIWFQKMGPGYETVASDVGEFDLDNNPLGEKIFRTDFGSFHESDLRNGRFSEFADGRSLKNFNTFFVTRDRREAQPGDLLFFYQPWVQKFPYHVMIFLGPARIASNGVQDWVVYHTGSSPMDKGTVKKVELSVLDRHPDPRWRPVESNKNFLGFYRLKILQ